MKTTNIDMQMSGELATILLVAPEGTSPMYTRAFVDDALWESEIGLYWMTHSGVQIKASYGSTSGEYRTNEEASVSFSIPLR